MPLRRPRGRSPIAAARRLTGAHCTDTERGTAPKQALSAGRPLSDRVKGTRAMIVLGADMHKRSHTLAAVAASTGELLGDNTIAVGERGFAAALDWAAGLGDDRIWALEDCRHVSG